MFFFRFDPSLVNIDAISFFLHFCSQAICQWYNFITQAATSYVTDISEFDNARIGVLIQVGDASCGFVPETLPGIVMYLIAYAAR